MNVSTTKFGLVGIRTIFWDAPSGLAGVRLAGSIGTFYCIPTIPMDTVVVVICTNNDPILGVQDQGGTGKTGTTGDLIRNFVFLL